MSRRDQIAQSCTDPWRVTPPAGAPAQRDDEVAVAYADWYAEPRGYLDYRVAFAAGWQAASRRPAVAESTGDTEALRDALRIHHPIMRSETGPFSGCRCGQVKLGQNVIAHVVAELTAALDAR